MSECENTGSQHPSPLIPPRLLIFLCPYSFPPLATSFLLTRPLTCSPERPHVRAPTPQVCWSASRAWPLLMLLQLQHFSSSQNFSLNSSFSFFVSSICSFQLFVLSEFAVLEEMLLLEEGSESEPLDQSIEDDPSGEEENILY